MNIHKNNIDFLNQLFTAGSAKGIKPTSNFDISFFKKGGGNYIYLIQNGKKKYLSRINYYHLKNEWQIKEHEYKVLKLIEPFRIGPKAYFLDVSEKKLKQHYIIIDYIEGDVLKQVRDKDVINLAKALKKLHTKIRFKKAGDSIPPTDSLPYACEIFNEFANGEDKQIEKYNNLPGIKKVIKPFNNKREELKNWFNNLDCFKNAKDFCLVHADLKKENIIKTPKGIALIDWEMAGSDIPETDIGRLFSGCRFTKKQEELFLKHYYGKSIADINMQRINAVKKVLNFFQILEDYILLKRKKWDAEMMKKRLENFRVE